MYKNVHYLVIQPAWNREDPVRGLNTSILEQQKLECLNR